VFIGLIIQVNAKHASQTKNNGNKIQKLLEVIEPFFIIEPFYKP